MVRQAFGTQAFELSGFKQTHHGANAMLFQMRDVCDQNFFGCSGGITPARARRHGDLAMPRRGHEIHVER